MIDTLGETMSTKFGTGAGGGTTASSGGMSAAAGMSILGSVLDIGSGIYGSILQRSVSKSNANLAQAQGNYASAVEEFNAAVTRANALAIRTTADLDIERQKKAAKSLKGSQIAGYAHAGVRLQGSPLEVMIDSAAQANLDIAITDYNAKIGMQQQSSRGQQYDIQGQMVKSLATSTSKLMEVSSKFERDQTYARSISSAGKTLLSTKYGF